MEPEISWPAVQGYAEEAFETWLSLYTDPALLWIWAFMVFVGTSVVLAGVVKYSVRIASLIPIVNLVNKENKIAQMDLKTCAGWTAVAFGIQYIARYMMENY